ncbi:MAG: hypothetical protein ACJ749_17400 [Flavisolibacter sp.]
MLLTIIILALIIATVVIVRRRTLFIRAFNNSTKRLAREAIETEAVLINMQRTGLYVNNLPQVKLQLQVQMETGWKFVTEAKEVLTFRDLSQLHIGGIIWVKYNPSNLKESRLVKL